MEHLTYEGYLADPAAVVERLARVARRERAAALHQLVIEPLRRLLGPREIR